LRVLTAIDRVVLVVVARLFLGTGEIEHKKPNIIYIYLTRYKPDSKKEKRASPIPSTGTAPRNIAPIFVKLGSMMRLKVNDISIQQVGCCNTEHWRYKNAYILSREEIQPRDIYATGFLIDQEASRKYSNNDPSIRMNGQPIHSGGWTLVSTRAAKRPCHIILWWGGKRRSWKKAGFVSNLWAAELQVNKDLLYWLLFYTG
jgi:hypothetical protein